MGANIWLKGKATAGVLQLYANHGGLFCEKCQAQNKLHVISPNPQ
jgi:hypothetical protein